VRRHCSEVLRALEASFSRGSHQPAPAESLFTIFQPLEQRVGEVRQQYLSGTVAFPKAIAWLGAMNFLEDGTRLIDHCSGQIRALRIERYAGDYAL
jgi:hypothetical protein